MCQFESHSYWLQKMPQFNILAWFYVSSFSFLSRSSINYNKLLMTILALRKFLQKRDPRKFKLVQVKDLRNKTFALDISNWLYHFLVKTRSQSKSGLNIVVPTDSMGNKTGHLIGLLSRVQFCLKNGFNILWVFDGKPSEQKYAELKRRNKLKDEAEQKIQQLLQQQKVAQLLKVSQRTVRITKNQKEDAKKMLELIGLPVIQAPSQAEAQCASIVKQGLAYATITEDMDTLAFGCPKIIKNFQKLKEGDIIQDQNRQQTLLENCYELDLQEILSSLDMTYEQFVEFCILCGCDYTSKIKNLGPARAFEFLKKYKNINGILEQIANNQKLARYTYQDQFNYLAAKKVFKKLQTIQISTMSNQNWFKKTENDVKLNYHKFDESQFRKFMQEKDFSDVRVNNWIQRVSNTNIFRQFLA